jgi:hypothetical protein
MDTSATGRDEMGWIFDLIFGEEKKSEGVKEADAKWAKQRKERQDREYGMSWLLGNEIDLINRQKGRKNWYGGTYTEEGGVHPDDQKKRNEGNNDWWF